MSHVRRVQLNARMNVRCKPADAVLIRCQPSKLPNRPQNMWVWPGLTLIGAGGIGFDVAEYLIQEGESPSLQKDKFFSEWGVDTSYSNAGGLQAEHIEKSSRKVYLLQRKVGKVGDGLGKTTGWIHRTSLKKREVEMVNGVTYHRIDDDGLHITVGEKKMTILWWMLLWKNQVRKLLSNI
jgi:NADPH-dependent 2,4-dienoyl-CoA reductase/sulfur reductase-like enzyme